MSLFEFLMILLSIFVGLGLAEILSNVAKRLKSGGLSNFSWIHGALTATVFLGLLQSFWESWGLRSQESWSYPAMLLMLGSPIFLFLVAHVLFPEPGDESDLNDYYFRKAPLLWTLAGLAVVVGTLFRPIAFDMPLFVMDNVSAVPTLAVCALLGFIKSRRVHQILVPLVLAFVLLDTLAISYSIG